MWKGIRPIQGLNVQCKGGETVDRVIESIKHGVFEIKNCTHLVIHIGTNNIETDAVTEIAFWYNKLLKFIKTVNPSVTVIISAILPRPKDFDIYQEKIGSTLGTHCQQVNKMLQSLAMKKSLGYMRSYKGFLYYGQPITKMFKTTGWDKGLHLSDKGKQALSECMCRYLSALKKAIFDIK